MKLIMGCVCSVAMVQVLAQTPTQPLAKSKAVVPALIQPSNPQRFLSQDGRQTKEPAPAMSEPKKPLVKGVPLVPVKPPSLGLCDGS